jgi:signal transduction histidine kinase
MSIRLRLAAVFTAAAAVLLALGSWLVITELSASLLSSIDAQLTARLATASRYLGGKAAPAPLPAGPAPGEYIVQVISPAGLVAGASPDAGRSPLLPAASLAQARHGRVSVIQADEDERERVIAEPLSGRRGGWVAVAATDLEAFDTTISDVTRSLVIAGAVFVAGAGLGSYGLARAALSPVERLRREVSALPAGGQPGHGPPTVRVPRTRDEIAALAVTMNQLLARLHRALARQRALVADASHELRTPFAVLRGELELAGRPGRSREELQDAVARAGEEAGRLARITEQLLFLARADEDMITPRRQPADVRALLSATAMRAAGRARQARISWDVRVPAGLTASLDPDRIREAVDNLADNALRFAPPGTAVVLAARAVGPAGRDLVIEVSDDGPGFPAEFLPHAFERFRRPDSGRARSEGGAGLGLPIVSAIAAAHGGRATAGNRAGGGAVITIDVPDAVAPAAG